MKFFATIFLAISILLQTFSTFIIQAEFTLNRSYIAKNLCENRDKPMMHCNGKCYLSKKLKQQEKQDEKAPVSKTEKFNIAPFFVPDTFTTVAIISVLKPDYFVKDEKLIYSAPASIFHPPSV